jgi:hypothetical protein
MWEWPARRLGLELNWSFPSAGSLHRRSFNTTLSEWKVHSMYVSWLLITPVFEN